MYPSLLAIEIDVPLSPFAIVIFGRGSRDDCAGCGSMPSQAQERKGRYRYWECIDECMCSLNTATVLGDSSSLGPIEYKVTTHRYDACTLYVFILPEVFGGRM